MHVNDPSNGVALMQALGRPLLVALTIGIAWPISGCSWFDQTRDQHRGTTLLLVGLSAPELGAQGSTTVGCAGETVRWAAQQGASLVMAQIDQPARERWQTIDFALKTEAQRTNPFAAKRWRERQERLALKELAGLDPATTVGRSADLLAAATSGSRVLNYRRGPRTLVLCSSAQQHSKELSLGPKPLSSYAIARRLYRLELQLEPMRLTRVIFGAAGDVRSPRQSLTEQAATESFWRAWARHVGAIHFSYGPIPHFPY
jgi:hypothetical protein